MKVDLTGEKFGVEIEVAGISWADAAEAVRQAVGGGEFIGRNEGPRHNYTIMELTPDERAHSRTWKVMYDASINRVNGKPGAEVVSPVLTYGPAAFESIRKVTHALRSAGAIPHSSCSVHVHVDGTYHDAGTISRLSKSVYKHEELIFMAIGTQASRIMGYAKKMDSNFISKICQERRIDDDKFNKAWFGRYSFTRPHHYEGTRYHGLNLNNLWRDLHTVEFRYANASLHAGKIKAYVQLYLALSKRARISKAASATKVTTNNPKYAMRTWMLSLGLIGEEFKACRFHLLAKLQGNSAWR